MKRIILVSLPSYVLLLAACGGIVPTSIAAVAGTCFCGALFMAAEDHAVDKKTAYLTVLTFMVTLGLLVAVKTLW